MNMLKIFKVGDEGYQTGKSDAIKECKMLVGTYGVKDIDSEETKIYIRAREEAVECLSKYEPHIGNWSWHGAFKEIQKLEKERDERYTIEEVIKMIEAKGLQIYNSGKIHPEIPFLPLPRAVTKLLTEKSES